MTKFQSIDSVWKILTEVYKWLWWYINSKLKGKSKVREEIPVCYCCSSLHDHCEDCNDEYDQYGNSLSWYMERMSIV
jgi:hypothetical protein